MFALPRIMLSLALGVAVLTMFGQRASAQENVQVEFTQEKLQEMHLTFLKTEGYIPKLNESGHIEFKCEGMVYYLFANPLDPNYFSLVLPGIYTLTDDGPGRQIVADCANTASIKVKVAKTLVVDESVWVAAEQFVAQPDQFEASFERTLRQLQRGRQVFLEEVQKMSAQPTGAWL